MNKLLLAIGFLSLGSGGLASAAQDAAAPGEQATPAEQSAPASRAARKVRGHTRIRIIDDAKVDVRFYRNRTCADGESVTASSNTSRQTGMFRSKTAVSIGIPETPTLERMKTRTGSWWSQAFYREYALAPGEPVAFQAGDVYDRRSEGVVCRRSPTFSFVPEPGNDYELLTDVDGVSCSVTLGRIDMSEGKAKVVPMVINETPNCGPNK
ncbi:hypothetical protein [Massilia genomosp. 1]|uniref:Secreted protein n=1 Tax=Massilia genomosp. 1 TaxID=2609280 RepID=A0ABX0MW21_9BURK|nr:hypothetical protein [Massilia genomosp. 1]NHZ63469.1 hypothetical protein [Massilia genomosp. 1]